VPDLIPLNRSERAYAALEGVAGSVSQVYEMTFDRSLDAAVVRAAARALIAAYPRTRTRLAVGPFSTRLAVLDNDGPLLEPLFDEAFRVVEGVAGLPDVDADEQRLAAYRNALLAEGFSLGRSLPIRIRLANHPSRPTVFFIVHHLVCDGRGMIQMIDAFLGALAGKPIATVPLDPPGMRGALWPKGALRWLRAAWIDWRRMRAAKRHARTVTLVEPLRPLPAFTAPRVVRHTLALPIAQLVSTSRAHGTSLTALTLAALTTVLARRQPATSDPHGDPPAGAAPPEVAVRISVDLRPYFSPPRNDAFGNFVASFMVRCTRFAERAPLIADIAAQLKEGTRRFRDHERGWGLLLDEVSTWVGLRLYALAARRLKTGNKLTPMSAHFSTVGSVDHLLRHDVGLVDIAGYAPNTGLFVTSMGFRDRLRVAVIYPTGALDEAQARELAQALEAALSEMSDLDTAAAPAPSAGATRSSRDLPSGARADGRRELEPALHLNHGAVSRLVGHGR
jgi:NRPS condensation-like uncharacterized protein